MRLRRIGWGAAVAVALGLGAALWLAPPSERTPPPPGDVPAAGEIAATRSTNAGAERGPDSRETDRSGLIVSPVALDPPIVIRDAHRDLVHAVPLDVPQVPDETSPSAGGAPPTDPPESTPPDDGADTPDPAPVDPTPAKEGALISPVLLRAAWVPYPATALKRKVEGAVDVRVRVEEDGSVSAVEVVSASPDTSLNRAARESARSMKFKPATQSGRSVSVWYSYRFDFKLPRS